MAKLTIDDMNLTGKRVLMRVDFNVPLNSELEITDDIRIRAALPSIKKIVDSGGKAILMSHLGRPKGEVIDSMRLAPAIKRLSELLGKDVLALDDCVGAAVKSKLDKMSNGDVVVLENLRFYKGETKNDPEFAKQLAEFGDVYINDAFGTAHRAHASTEGVTKYFDQCAAGYLIQKELKYLGGAINNPARPLTAILGGAKISGKIDVIETLLDKVNSIIIGGGMAYTFFKAQGIKIGNSLLEEDKIELAKNVSAKAKEKDINFVLPIDNIIAQEISDTATTKTTDGPDIPDGWSGVDIGPKSLEKFTEIINNSKTIVWNGPMGIFEKENFAKGTMQVAETLATQTEAGAITVIGGGDSAAAIKRANLSDKITHVSTGGGASLEFLGGIQLPGIVALSDK